MIYRFGLAGLFFLLAASLAQAGQVVVAVAANFTGPAQDIAAVFKQETGHDVTLSYGATGGFYNQIAQGAPFDVFLAADNVRPEQAIDEGYGVTGTNFTYAVGKLVLWRANGKISGAKTLLDPSVNHIAYGNPDTVPYGRAAVEVMEALGFYEILKPKRVEGRNIEQVFQFVDTGNAEIGFVALSQVIKRQDGAHWDIPQSFYRPIRQNAVLLKTAEDNEAAKAFLEFLKTPQAKKIIRAYGYALP
ncbi:MAG: Molybdenum ABC transporter periplasmic molybdate-binding protein (precursor) [Candidatus Tokpelaia hoelldobleri]|uniref:Molybdenum ABC transporter periplasmic molybdate-binding protein (Precursor) n=1 Tax=Candidatus Tokpelaia hoelldobleri TaxID=1902579 RepID=A0A1U9JWQ0_9HYPH|nr:MAG: Molybdenum ABC transporter periplasmic molybdate-binding protein (precursor) [Candidatus Tokpelaia hoelldoblerii]